MVIPHLEISPIHARIVINEQDVMIPKMVISIVFFFCYRECTLYYQLNVILLKEILIRGS
jgi:hypothetical protein